MKTHGGPCSGRVFAALAAVTWTLALGAAALFLHVDPATAQQSPPIADGTPEIDQAIAQKNWQSALQLLDRRVADRPHDAQAAFKRATVLARLGRADDAIAGYTALTQQYPELPEPYNNLAALYAQRGDYERARTLLETAVAANPNFTLAYRNLGDLYLRLSAQAYGRAAQLNPRDALAASRQKAATAIFVPAPGTPGAATHAAPAPMPIQSAPALVPGTVGLPAAPYTIPRY